MLFSDELNLLEEISELLEEGWPELRHGNIQIDQEKRTLRILDDESEFVLTARERDTE